MRFTRFVLLPLFLVWVSGCQTPPTQTKADPGLILAELQDTVWQRFLDTAPDYRIKFGLPITELPNLSYEFAQGEAAFYQGILDRLATLDETALTAEQRLTYGCLKWHSQTSVEWLDHYWLPFAAVPYAWPDFNTIHQIYATRKLDSTEAVDQFLTLLDKYPTWVHALRARYEGQLERGIVMPKDQLDVVVPMFTGFRQEPESSPLKIAGARIETLDAPTVAHLNTQLAETIRTKINPALTSLIEYLDGPYRAKAPDAVGPAQYPGGSEYYRFRVRYHTTLDLTPEEIHQSGLRAVEQLEQKIAGLMQELAFAGTRAEFRATLEADPRFYVDTPEAVGERLMSYIGNIEPRVPEFFTRQPKAPYGVRRLPESLEPAMTFGYYEWPTEDNPEGNYLYNGSKLNERSLLTAESLIYHELIPGHHFHIALQGETEGLHDYRRGSFHTAYTEGWAEYAAGLGEEMGGYKDPYDRVGRCFSEMFFAVRLVVDTGMNAMGWSREKAMNFMRTHLIESETQIQSESLRYSVPIPGQALAYRIGAEKIRELRRKAEAELGDRFDIRRFHAAVLDPGSLPLTVLEQHIDHFIKTEKAK